MRLPATGGAATPLQAMAHALARLMVLVLQEAETSLDLSDDTAIVFYPPGSLNPATDSLCPALSVVPDASIVWEVEPGSGSCASFIGHNRVPAIDTAGCRASFCFLPSIHWLEFSVDGQRLRPYHAAFPVPLPRWRNW